MSKKISSINNIVATVSLGCLLSACVSITPVKDVTADQAGYLSKKFTPQLLSENIAKKLPSDANANKFNKLIITSEITSENSDGKKESSKSVETFINVGNGLIQRMAEMSNNDISYALVYSLTYKGMIPLKWQEVPLRATNASMLYEVKDTTRFDSMPSTTDKEFVVDYTTGTEPQIANFFSYHRTCKSTRTMSATEIHKSLAGRAIEIECRLSSNNAVQNRTKWALLDEYGVAIQVEYINSAKKTTIRVVDAKG